jgi:DNA polymerase elongation subunit (family B)
MYVSARLNKKTEKVDVVERVNGKRLFNSFPVDYSFYFDDPNGSFRTIYNTPVSKIEPKTSSEFHRELASLHNRRIWESDLNPIFKCLAQHYRHQNPPELHVAFLDIEVDFDKDKGYAPIDDPFSPITAITVKQQWTGELITLALRPRTYTEAEANEIGAKFENTMIFNNEIDLINAALDLIDDADVISGWNSEGFDLPYIVNRIARVMSKDDTRRLCLWGERPKDKVVQKYGTEFNTYELIGRTHLDLMNVYRKFTYEERHSYALNAISEHELKQSKTPYSGSLDKLYYEDFEKFIEYNRQDVTLLSLLEDKLKLLELLNDVAHNTTTLLQTCMGTVAVIDQAITNRAHDFGMIVNNKKRTTQSEDNLEEDDGAAGAYVAAPKAGLHEWVGVIDINSLYPSCIRALNMGLEKIVGQLRPIMTDQYIDEKIKDGNTFAAAWEGLFGSLEYQAVMAKRPGIDVTIDWEMSGTNDTVTAEECYELIFNSGQPWMLSGNGTIFAFDKDAIFPGLLADWYKERKEFQKKMHEATDQKEKAFYKRRQLVQKILLNSAYGATLSPSCRFYDKRFGQSVTLSGRVICKHMNSYVNECITGDYAIDGAAIIAADTDSSQFSAWSTLKPMVDRKELEWTKESAVQLYIAIGEKVNASFPEFMATAFNCPEQFGSLIKASCESIGYRGLYITKKRYAILNYFFDGDWLKEPKLKAMGLDLRRSDTPAICQVFLKELLMSFLKEGSEQTIITMINDFKKKFKSLPPAEQGTPKRINKLTYYAELIQKGKGNRVPGHVRAAINWNLLREINRDKVHARIVDGMKCVVCPMKDNSMNMTSVAYPIDEIHLPDWFTKLPFDNDHMIASVVDKKIENLFGKLKNWKTIESSTKKANTFDDFFS